MAIGFEYTLGVDESASLKNLQDFIDVISDVETSMKLNFDISDTREAINKLQQQISNLNSSVAINIGEFDISTQSLQAALNEKSKDVKLTLKVEFDDMALKEYQVNPSETIKKNFEKDLQLMQDGVLRMLNNLNVQMQKANIGNDIINVEELEQKVKGIDLEITSFKEAQQVIKEVKNDIASWQQAIKLNNNLLTNTGKVTDELREKMKEVNKEMGNDSSAELQRSISIFERRLKLQQDGITRSRQFKEATDDVRNAITQEIEAMKLSGNSIKEVSNSYQDMSLRLREINSDLKTSHIEENGYAFNNLANNVKGLAAQYIGLDKAISLVEDGFRSAFQYVMNLDDAYTDVAISMDLTRAEFDAWTGTATEIARANGLATDSIMDMVKIYATAGEDLSMIQDKLAGTAAIQNVTQWSAEESTSAVNSIIKQYQLLDREINGVVGNYANAINYMGDALIGVSNALSIDNVKGIQEIVSAVDDAGAVVNTAGGSMEWFMGITGTLAETMNATGSEVGAAMRMISARTLQQKQAFMELNDTGEDVETVMANAEKALKQIGVSIRDDMSGELRGLEDILGDVAEKWQYLDDSTKQFVGEKLAGNNRRSYFESLMENYSRVEKLQQEGLNATGALMEANEIRADSLEGKFATLADTVNRLFSAFLQSETLGAVVDGLDKILNGVIYLIEHLEITIPLVVALGAAWTAIKWNSISSDMMKVVASMSEMVAKGTLLQGATAAIKGGLVGLAAGAVTAGFMAIYNHAKQTQEAIDGLASSVVEMENTVSSGANGAALITQYRDAAKELETLTEGTEEQRQKQEEVNKLRAELVGSNATFKSILDDENASLDEQYQKMKLINEMEMKDKIQDLIDKQPKNNSFFGHDMTEVVAQYNHAIGLIEGASIKLKNIQDEIAKQEALETSLINSDATKEEVAEVRKVIDDLYQREIEQKAKLEEFYTRATGKKAEIDNYNELIRLGKQYNADLDGRVEITENRLLANEKQVLATATEMIGIYDEIGDEVEGATDKVEGMKAATDDLAESTSSMKQANSEYLEALEDIEEAQKLLDSFKEGLTTNELRSIFDSDLMADYNGALSDSVAIQEHLNSKIEEMQETASNAYYEMNRESADFWNNQIKNSQSWLDYEKQVQDELTQNLADTFGIQLQDFQNFIAQKGGLRDVDLSNAQNLADAERILNGDLNSQILNFFSQFINGKADARVDDMDNVVAFLKAQNTEEVKTIQQLARLWDEYYKKKRAEINSVLKTTQAMKSSTQKYSQSQVDAANKKANQLGLKLPGFGTNSLYGGSGSSKVNAAIDILEEQIKQLDEENTSFTELLGKLNGYNASNTLKQNYTNANKNNFGGSGSSGGKGSSSSSSKKTEKEVEDLDLKIDKYQELEEAINRVDEALSRNQEAQRMVSTKAELKKLLEEEIKLMEKKQKAIGDLRKEVQKEQQDLKKQLEKSGLKFDGDELVGDKKFGSVADRLQDAQKWANSAKGAEKEWRKNDVLYLQESIERYYELMNQLGDVNSQYNDMAYEIRQAKKEQEELLKAVENLADRYLKFTMKEKALNNELSLNRRKQEYAIGEELLKLRERELKILQEQKKANGDKISELTKERQELEKILKQNGFTLDANGLITNYDKKWQDKTDKYNGLAGTKAEDYKEYLDELGDSIDRYLEIVNDELPEAEEYYYDIADALKEIEDQQKEWAKQLEEVMDLFDRLHDTTNKLNKAENELALIESQLSVAQGDEKIALLKRQEELYKAQQKLMKEKLNIQKEQAKEMQAELGNLGVTFDTDGFVSNYESLVKKMQQQIEAMPGGTARDEAIEELEELLAKIEEYEDLVNNEIPSTEQTWWELNASIKDAQREQLQIVEDVQSSIANAIKNKWQENTQALQDEIDKQKDMLNKQWKEEDWEDSLGKAEMELNKLQAQINNLSKDTSLAGQLKLEQLKEQYKEQLEAINDMIKDHEREQANQMLEDEKDKLTEEMENALTAENLANAVNNALATGMVKIGDEYMSLNDLMLDSIAQQEEAYFALGDVIRDEMISSLKEASALLKDIESISKSLTSNSLATSSYLGNTHFKSVEKINPRFASVLENNNSPLVSIVMNGSGLDGNVTMKDVNKAVNKGIDECLVRLEKLMR